jgi:hypothetical protein
MFKRRDLALTNALSGRLAPAEAVAPLPAGTAAQRRQR